MSKTPSNPNPLNMVPKPKNGATQIQHHYDIAIEILSKSTQYFINYLKYLTECSKQLKKVNETIAGISCGKVVHPQLKDINIIFDGLEKSNQEMRKFIKSDQVKNYEKRESRENDFIAKKKQELKKAIAQITNLHNDVIRIIKKPPDCINCFNALEDGFKYHCSYLFYCTRLTLCQDKLLGCIDEIREEVLSIKNDICKLQYECNNYAFKSFLQYNPQYSNANELGQNYSNLPPEEIEQISQKFESISKHLKKSVSIFREPQFPSLHLYHFTSPFKALDESDTDVHAITVSFNSSKPLLIEPNKMLKEKSLAKNLTPPSSHSVGSDTASSPSNHEENFQMSFDEPSKNTETRLEDFLASDSGSSSDEEPFHELNSSFQSMVVDNTPIEHNGTISQVTSNQNLLKSVSSNDGNTAANYHQKISSGLAAKPRKTMKFIAMKQYKCEDFGKELSVEEKDIVQVLDANMTEYWYCKKGNSEGFLPAIILEPFLEQNKRLKSMNVKDSPSPI